MAARHRYPNTQRLLNLLPETGHGLTSQDLHDLAPDVGEALI